MAYIVKQPATGGRIHIHLARNHHDPEKRGARQSREYLGVLDDKKNELLLGAGKPEPTEEVIQLLLAKGIQYNGRSSIGPGRKRIRPVKNLAKLIKQPVIEEIGRLEALSQMAGKCGLRQALSDSFGENIGLRILQLAIYQASEGKPLYLAEDWAEEAGIDRGLSSSSISRLCVEIGNNGSARDVFFKRWIEACGKPKALIHDTTSISTYSAELEEAEWGYNRDGDKLPQINLALVLARESRLPLWFRTVPGSIPDVSTLKLTCKMLEAYGLKSFSCSLDRGYFSQSNLVTMLDAEISFTIGVPLNIKQAGEIIRKYRKTLNASKRSFLYQGKRIRHIACRYTIINKGKSVDLSGHLFFDPERHESSASRLEAGVLELEHKAGQQKFLNAAEAHTWRIENGGRLSCFLSVKEKGEEWIILRKSNAVSKAVSNFGITLIITDIPNQCPADTLDDYRCRDIAEKIFNIVKNDIGSDKLRTGKSHSVQGRLFIAFVSVLLRSLIESGLRETDLLKLYSVDEALGFLRKVKRIRLADGNKVISEIPKKARIIAEAFDVTFQ